MSKTAVVILSAGEPLKPDALKNFFLRLYNDPYLFAFPYFRNLLTKFHAGRKLKPAIFEYESVINQSEYKNSVREFVNKLKGELKARNLDADVYHAARYTVPLIRKISIKVTDGNYDSVVVTTVNPFYSKVISGSFFREWEKVHGQKKNSVNVTEFYNQKNFVAAVSERIAITLRDHQLEKPDNPLILFAAESASPIEVENGDPYVDQLKETCELVMSNFSGYKYKLGYYNHLILDKMLSPSVDDLIKNADTKNVVVVPLSSPGLDFHTFYKLKIELKNIATASGIKTYCVAGGILESEKFNTCMVSIVKGALKFAEM
ncbi:MAG: ferrochelatase [Melioribacteraceae bacterium]|nr:MAG: ferrochelatase [Melioribacteraceae bacterium]